MSNSSIKTRLTELLDGVELRALSVFEFEDTVDAHISAIENIDSLAFDMSRELTSRLVEAITADGDRELQELCDFESPSVVLRDFRAFVASLPT